MAWSATSFDWNQVRAFLATAEEGSFSAAARALGLTQPTLGRQVAALEIKLEVTLFERTARGPILTDTGRDLLAHVKEMRDAATRLSLAASGRSERVEGLVRVSASEMYSGEVLPDLIVALRDTHPGIEIEVVATNELSDLRHRDADIALRNSRPDDPALIARLIREDRAGLYATPGLLATRPPVRHAADIVHLPLVGFGDDAEYLAMLRSLDLPVALSQVCGGSRTHWVHWALVRAGLGAGVNATWIAEQQGGLTRILPDLVDFTFPVWLVAPRELQTSLRIRTVFDALADWLSRTP